MSKVSQLYCSNSVIFFEKNVAKFLKLNKYTDKNAPVLFFGVYRNNSKDYNVYLNHKGKEIYLLAG